MSTLFAIPTNSVVARSRDKRIVHDDDDGRIQETTTLTALPLQQADNKPTQAKFENARRLVNEDLQAVNQQVLTHLTSEVPLIPDLARHLIAAGGKRIRPVLTLLSARLCGYCGDRHVGLAAAVEFIHTATLLHDDVVDESDLRRGRSTANAVWGNKAPVLVGDFLFSRAFQLMVADGNLRVLEVLSNASAVIAEGEVAQLLTANDMATDEAAYFDVIERKTAALFAAACQIGAVVADRQSEEEEALRVFGRQLGLAFQLVDDALDYSARQAVLGKTVGDDFQDGKVTLPVILAYADGDENERSFWRRTIEQLEQNDGDMARAQELIARHRGVERTLDHAIEAGRSASASLAVFPASPNRDAMDDLVEFCLDRAY